MEILLMTYIHDEKIKIDDDEKHNTEIAHWRFTINPFIIKHSHAKTDSLH